MSIQTSIIMFLIIYFAGNFFGSFLFLAVYGAIMGYLLSPMVPFELLEGIQGINIIIVILSKVSDFLVYRLTLCLLGNFSCFFVVCLFFFKSTFLKILSGIPSEWQTVCKDYQQTALGG